MRIRVTKFRARRTREREGHIIRFDLAVGGRAQRLNGREFLVIPASLSPLKSLPPLHKHPCRKVDHDHNYYGFDQKPHVAALPEQS